jgi:hypothetical protein
MVSEDTISAIGGYLLLTTQVIDTDGVRATKPSVSFSTPTPSVLSISQNGATVSVTGLAAGTGQVIARRGALADTATIQVLPVSSAAVHAAAAAPFQLVPHEMLFDRPNSMWFVTGRYTDASGSRSVLADFRSTNATVVRIDEKGWVRAARTGKALIIGSYNGLTDTIRVQVGGVTVATLMLKTDTATIGAVGDEVRLYSDALDPAGRLVINPALTWRSLNPHIAAVTGDGGVGTVEALAKGTAKFVVDRGTLSDTATVYIGGISNPGAVPASIDITPAQDTISAIGATSQLRAIVMDKQGAQMAGQGADWASLDPSVADVGTGGPSETRTVKALTPGKARIVASTNGVADTAVVHVAPTISSVTWNLSHSPLSPTTSTQVTVSADASDPTAIASIVLSVDGTTVKTCRGGSCAWTGALAAGIHSYSAVATLTSGTQQAVGSGTIVVVQPQPGNKAGYSPTSPHWRHMRTSTIDYRIHYQKGSQQQAEYDWAAGHFDHVTGGTLNQYKSRNPTIKHFPYDTYWFVPVAYAAAAEKWLAANGHSVENAYLHKAGAAKTKANRIMKQQFQGRDYWYYNLGDPGFQAWRRYTTRGTTGMNAQGFRSDGLFFDTNSRATVRKYVPAATLEYASLAEYLLDFDALLNAHRAWVPAGYLVLNQSTYFNKADEQALSKIAGGTMLEFVNGPYRDPQWAAVDQAINNGVVVEYGTAIKANHKGNIRYGVTRGNYASVKERVLMWEYASYLMVVNPNYMDRLYFEPYLGSWDTPMHTVWLEAFEQDIGLATAQRRVIDVGTDPAGQSYQVFQRQFENALVLIRPQGSTGKSGNYEYGDNSAVTVNLPAGTWRMLLPDGSTTGSVSSVKIRCGEAVILTK